MKTNVLDIWDEEIFVGDTVRCGFKQYVVRYGNFKYFGCERIGIYLENTSQTNPPDVIPLAQARALIKVK